MRRSDLTIDFADGEEMLTEVSCKFRADGVAAELADAGLRRTHWWTDSAGDFGLSLSTRMRSDMRLAEQWRAARPQVAGLHLDSAACSRQSFAVIDAATQHARHEAEVGGYVAAEAAGPVLDAGRAAIAAMTGLSSDDVVFTTGANNALDTLLSSWPGERTSPACRASTGRTWRSWPPTVSTSARCPPTATAGSTSTPPPRQLAADPPALVHLTALASHRGVAQPMAALADVCRDLGLPLVVDAAQALGHLDCAVGPAAIYSSSRKWMAGPRGVGFLAVRPDLAQRLKPRLPPPEWGLPLSLMQRLEQGEANVAARIGYSVALGEHLAAGPANRCATGWPRSAG